jgi:hypothetical protein
MSREACGRVSMAPSVARANITFGEPRHLLMMALQTHGVRDVKSSSDAHKTSVSNQ